MSLVKKVGSFFSELLESLRLRVDPTYTGRDLEADFKRLEGGESVSETELDGRTLVRIRNLLRRKGFDEAALEIDIFDAHMVRTGSEHSVFERSKYEPLAKH